LAKVIRITDKRVVKVVHHEPMKDIGINCGVYFAVMLITVILDRIFPFKTALTCVLVLVPYLLLFGFILVRRWMQRPEFPVGSPIAAVYPLMLVWIGAVLVAAIFAYNNGLFSSFTLVGKLNHFGTIFEEPLAQEFIFRAALLTSLKQTDLGELVFFHVEARVMAGALIFSVLHAVIFLVAGFSFLDVLMTGFTSLILGAVYGWIYTRTNNVWYGVLIHALINFGRWG